MIICIGNNTVNENFYPFGASVGDAQVPVALDESSPPISLFIPFQFFEASESTLFVSPLLVFIYMQTGISDVTTIMILIIRTIQYIRTPPFPGKMFNYCIPSICTPTFEINFPISKHLHLVELERGLANVY